MKAVTLGLAAVLAIAAFPAIGTAQTADAASEFVKQILDPALSPDERGHQFEPKPELFLQFRFSRFPMSSAPREEANVNFQVTRAEVRWSGQLSKRVGAGLEMQFHPLLDGSPEEVINDAFVEFYATSTLTIRAGQFIKPFGFDIQRSSADREYPERGNFAGYFFPGQRDRGVMLMWSPQSTRPALRSTQFLAAVLNGNRFFNDNDDRLDTLIRVRRLVPKAGLAVGASLQLGSQIVPPGMEGGEDVHIVGIDAQYSNGRIGARLEWLRGTRPSTLLSLDPVYTDAFAVGSRTGGLTAVFLCRTSDHDQWFGRLDRLTGDPMTGDNVRVVDWGYRRIVTDASRLTISYQWKDEPTVNDDAVNARFHVTFGIEF